MESEITIVLTVPVEPPAAHRTLIEALELGLSRRGIGLETGPEGRVVQDGLELARVTSRSAGRSLVLEWRPVDWQPDRKTRIELTTEEVRGGARITLSYAGLDGLLDPAELVGWFASEFAAPSLAAATPAAFGDWITDRRARRPSGEAARATYRDPIYHYPNFAVILEELGLTPADRLLEVGCGGGALLNEALKTGCTAAAVDHSPDMVRVARELNAEAVAAGRVRIVEGTATRLPFPDAFFTAATLTGVLGFLEDPVSALREILRTLEEGGRLVALGSDPRLRGTMAAPEPFASRLHFYEDDELAELARKAGFDPVRVVRRDLEPHARGRVPDEHLSMFAGEGEPFLLARKG